MNGVDRGERIGTGRTAEVFALPDGRVLKLLRPGFEGSAKAEYDIAVKISRQGVGAPDVHALVEQDGRMGIIYERIHGQSMNGIMAKNPLSFRRMARKMAALHYQMHTASEKDTGLPALKPWLAEVIRNEPLLSSEDKARVLRRLDTLPDGNRLCHMDFHPDNVLVDGSAIRAIDWVSARAGDPYADVCRTCIMLGSTALPPGLSRRDQWLMQRLRQGSLRVYRRAYLKLSGGTMDDIYAWKAPLAAARLREGMVEERAYLMDMIAEKGE